MVTFVPLYGFFNSVPLTLVILATFVIFPVPLTLTLRIKVWVVLTFIFTISHMTVLLLHGVPLTANNCNLSSKTSVIVIFIIGGSVYIVEGSE